MAQWETRNQNERLASVERYVGAKVILGWHACSDAKDSIVLLCLVAVGVQSQNAACGSPGLLI